VKSDGTLRIVPTPGSCKRTEVLFSWNVQGPPGDIDQPQNITVNCAVDTVAGTLERAGDGVARLDISIQKFCNESVSVSRSNVTLRALTSDAGVRDITLDGAHGIQLTDLTLSQTLLATNGAAFVASNLKVTNSATPVLVEDSATGRLDEPVLTDCTEACIKVNDGGSLNVNYGTLQGHDKNTGIGLIVENGGSIDLTGTAISNSMWGLDVIFGGSADVRWATIEGCGGGIIASGVVRVEDTIIQNNFGNGGLNVQPGGYAEIAKSKVIDNTGGGAGSSGGVLRISDTDILRNGGGGFGADLGGYVLMWGSRVIGNGDGSTSRGATLQILDTVISNNRGRGIEARNASTVLLAGTTVQDNEGDGIWLGDVSFLEVSTAAPGGPLTVVTGNAGYGLYCSPAPSVAQYKVYSESLTVSGNAGNDPEKQIKCVPAAN